MSIKEFINVPQTKWCSSCCQRGQELLVLDKAIQLTSPEGLRTCATLALLVPKLEISLTPIKVVCLTADRKASIVDDFKTAVNAATDRIELWLQKSDDDLKAAEKKPGGYTKINDEETQYKARIQMELQHEHNAVCTENRAWNWNPSVAESRLMINNGFLMSARPSTPMSTSSPASSRSSSRMILLHLPHLQHPVDLQVQCCLFGQEDGCNGFRAMSQSSSSSGKNVDSGEALKETQAFQDKVLKMLIQKQPKNANLFRTSGAACNDEISENDCNENKEQNEQRLKRGSRNQRSKQKRLQRKQEQKTTTLKRGSQRPTKQAKTTVAKERAEFHRSRPESRQEE
ncbi:hypothetical protein DFJ73DRAFT_771824 [Zopfochytrium polystomum]|nr:hypothetical protein DFJ73DRAFT_771824 [Zopfochytrium polystomum]